MYFKHLPIFCVTKYIVLKWCFDPHYNIGPNHINIYLSPKPGVQLTGWSVGDGAPQPTEMASYSERPHYFIFYSYGTKPEQPFELRIDFQVSEYVQVF